MGNFCYMGNFYYLCKKNTMERQSAAKVEKQKQMNDRLVGKTFNNIKVLSYAYSKNSRKYFNVLCLKCNKESEMRGDRFTGLQKLETCSKCRQQNAIDKSKSRSTEDTIKNILYRRYKYGATSRGIAFNLSKSELINIVNKDCIYCGKTPEHTKSSIRISRNNYNFKHNSIDRFDNSIGYTIDNAVSCCITCNMMKKNLDVKDFLNHINNIYVFQQGSTTMPKGSTLQANGSGNGRNPEMDCDIV
jgi:hypothetical protein